MKEDNTMREQIDEVQQEDCPHPEERTFTYSTNTISGCGGPPERQITHCNECSKIINVVDDSS